MKNIEKSMQSRLNKAARDLNLDSGKTIKLDSNSFHGYHFRWIASCSYEISWWLFRVISNFNDDFIYYRITLKEEPILRKNKSYEILDAIKGGVRFTNTALVDLNEEYKQSKDSYEDHQKNVVDEIIRIAGIYHHLQPVCVNCWTSLMLFHSYSELLSSGFQLDIRPFYGQYLNY